jgi:hypothetical protein
VWVSLNVGFPVTFPEFGGVVEILSVGWDDFVTETSWGVRDSWDHNILNVIWVVVVVSGFDGSNKGDGNEFHFFIKSDYLNYFQES